jgi:hypothetical protein
MEPKFLDFTGEFDNVSQKITKMSVFFIKKKRFI